MNINYIEHLIEPTELLLSWQPPQGSGKGRIRRFVGKIVRHGNDANLIYLPNTEDYKEAIALGFQGYTGFPTEQIEHKNVLQAFVRRLPPRKRNDFGKFLSSLRINPNDKDNVSDFALLGYSSAILPGDCFSIINTYNNIEPPFELLTCVQGYKYYTNEVPYEQIALGSNLSFACETDNKYDSNAVVVFYNDQKIGYLCRGISDSFQVWLNNSYNIKATVERINGTNDNPKIYIMLSVNGNF